MIRSFKGEFAKAIHDERRVPPGFPADLAMVARRKLVQLNNAVRLSDLARLADNAIEAWGTDRDYAIPINDRWRIVFRWTPEGPEKVEIIEVKS